MNRALIEEAQARLKEAQESLKQVQDATKKYTAIGGKLAEIRHEANLSQHLLSVGLGLSRTQVTNIERGNSGISLSLFIVWCNLCGQDAALVLAAFLTSSGLSQSEL